MCVKSNNNVITFTEKTQNSVDSIPPFPTLNAWWKSALPSCLESPTGARFIFNPNKKSKRSENSHSKHNYLFIFSKLPHGLDNKSRSMKLNRGQGPVQFQRPHLLSIQENVNIKVAVKKSVVSLRYLLQLPTKNKQKREKLLKLLSALCL